MRSKEDSMRRLLLSLMPVNLIPANMMHELGTGRALENACRERDEVARTMALVDALAGRLQPATLVAELVEERAAA
jgi:hypothetical protein